MMEFQSCFDIIGPIMVGPSSSHTAGVVSIGRFVHEMLGECPEQVEIILYDSFAETYKGHGTDKALIGGLIGMDTDDTRIKDAVIIAKEKNMIVSFLFENSCPYFDHPNTTVIVAKSKNLSITVGGVSLGGGLSKIFLINEQQVDIRLSTSEEIVSMCQHLRQEHIAKSELVEA